MEGVGRAYNNIGARGFIIFVTLQVNVPISSGAYKWRGGAYCV